MLRLNANLVRTLAVCIPHNGRENFIDYLEDPRTDLRGMGVDEVSRYVAELEDMGLLTTEKSADRDDDCTIYLRSDAASYFRDSKAELAKTALRYLFQLVVGASGGLVALLVQRLLAP